MSKVIMVENHAGHSFKFDGETNYYVVNDYGSLIIKEYYQCEVGAKVAGECVARFCAPYSMVIIKGE